MAFMLKRGGFLSAAETRQIIRITVYFIIITPIIPVFTSIIIIITTLIISSYQARWK